MLYAVYLHKFYGIGVAARARAAVISMSLAAAVALESLFFFQCLAALVFVGNGYCSAVDKTQAVRWTFPGY